MSEDVVIRTELAPGDLGRLIALHGTAYGDDPVHFGLKFEAHVARTVAEFVIDNDAKGRVWLAERNGETVGCAAMVDRGDQGQLRWVVLAPAERGKGLGEKLIRAAIDYAEERDYREVYLETTDGLDASMAIYKKLGFEIAKEETQSLWGRSQNVIIMVKKRR